MAASPQTVTNYPLFLNGRTLAYTAREFRQSLDDSEIGPGALDYDSFRVRQRAAGLNQSVDVVAASVLNRAYVRSTIQVNDGISASGDAGLYRIDYNSGTVINLDIAAADGSNPRIDSVYLCVEDQQATGVNNQATIRVVTGTATIGATLDNRTGAGVAPAGMASILLADVLVPTGSVNVPTANIRDRRPITGPGTVPWLGSTGSVLDQVMPQWLLTPGIQGASGVTAGTSDNTQTAVAFTMPRRLVGITKIRWKYLQGGTANAGNHCMALYDASGRLINTSGAVAFTGAAGAVIGQATTIPSTTLDAGVYYLLVGIGAMTGASSMSWYGIGGSAVASSAGALSVPWNNVDWRSAAGGTAAPTTLLALTDMGSSGGVLIHPGVPFCTLSVT